MEFIFEFLGEFFGELFIGLPLEGFLNSKKVKRGVKIAFYVVFWGLVELVLAWALLSTIRSGEPWPLTLFALVGNAVWIYVGFQLWPDVKKLK